jgi:hypothetical protein
LAKLQAGGQSFGLDLARRRLWLSPGEIDAVSVVNEAVEDGVGICRIAEHGAMPQ